MQEAGAARREQEDQEEEKEEEEVELLALLRPALRLAREALPPAELQQLLRRWTEPAKLVGRVVEERPDGSLCAVRGGSCFLPAERLPVGERVCLQLLPAAAGLPWGSWAEARHAVDEGWELGAVGAARGRSAKSRGEEGAPAPAAPAPPPLPPPESRRRRRGGGGAGAGRS